MMLEIVARGKLSTANTFLHTSRYVKLDLIYSGFKVVAVNLRNKQGKAEYNMYGEST